jgi:hypothetical protein
MMYATTPKGVRVPIPLIQAGSYNVADIKERLKKAGVTDAELPYVVFSPADPASLANVRRNAVTAAAVSVPGVARAAVDEPKIPVPTAPNVQPPMHSDFVLEASVAVTPNWKQITGCRYSMKRADNQGYVSVQDLDISAFQDPEDYHRIQDGRIKLCYGLVWRRGPLHFLKQGDKWVDTVQTKRGMSSTTSVSISASVGYSGYGASASITATYGYSITVNTETTVTIEVSVLGTAGESQTAVLWDLCRKYVVMVDGVARDESNPYTLVFKDKGGAHQLANTWGPDYEVVSEQPTLMPTVFKNPGGAVTAG